MTKYISIMGMIIFFILVLFSLSFAQQPENITITTYYPSPYGSYNELQLYPHTTPVTPCNTTTKGTMYYDGSQIWICNGTGYVTTTGYWAASTVDTTDIYNTNTGDVGIGTTNPGYNLEVSKANVGGSNVVYIFNSDNTDSTSSALARIGTGGGSAGDPYVLFDIAGVQGWSMGIDNSDSDKFKIAATSAGLGTASDVLTIQTNGSVGIGDLSPDTGTQAAPDGQPLKLDIEGAVGAEYYCDKDGNNCKTITQIGAGGALPAGYDWVTLHDALAIALKDGSHADAACGAYEAYGQARYLNGVLQIRVAPGGVYANWPCSEGTKDWVNGLSTYCRVANDDNFSAQIIAEGMEFLHNMRNSSCTVRSPWVYP